MKKVLYSSTALAAASALALIPTGDAYAAEKAKKISLGFGGGMTSLVGFAQQDESFEKSSVADTAGVTHYDAFNVSMNSEIEIKGSVKLDSGITVSIEVEFETDQEQANASGGNSDTGIDNSFMKITGGFGDIRIGGAAPVTAVLSQNAPWTGALFPGVETVQWVHVPSAVLNNGANPWGKHSTTNGASDQVKLQYISPQFAGLRVGAFYEPESAGATQTQGMPRIGGTGSTVNQTWGAVVNYENKFGAVTLKADVGAWYARGSAASSNDNRRFGAKILFGDITVGGSYLKIADESPGTSGVEASDEEERFDLGVLFKPKGYSIGLHYLHAEGPETSGVAGDDSKTTISMGATYDLGPGVSAVATVFHADYEDETSNDSNNNSGWAAVAGVKVRF